MLFYRTYNSRFVTTIRLKNVIASPRTSAINCKMTWIGAIVPTTIRSAPINIDNANFQYLSNIVYPPNYSGIPFNLSLYKENIKVNRTSLFNIVDNTTFIF